MEVDRDNWNSGLAAAGSDLSRFQREVDRLGKQRVGCATRGAIAAGLVAGGIKRLGDAALEAGNDAASFNRAVGNFKGGFPLAEMQAFTGQLQRLTGIEDDVIAGSVGLLGTFGATA